MEGGSSFFSSGGRTRVPGGMTQGVSLPQDKDKVMAADTTSAHPATMKHLLFLHISSKHYVSCMPFSRSAGSGSPGAAPGRRLPGGPCKDARRGPFQTECKIVFFDGICKKGRSGQGNCPWFSMAFKNKSGDALQDRIFPWRHSYSLESGILQGHTSPGERQL